MVKEEAEWLNMAEEEVVLQNPDRYQSTKWDYLVVALGRSHAVLVSSFVRTRCSIMCAPGSSQWGGNPTMAPVPWMVPKPEAMAAFDAASLTLPALSSAVSRAVGGCARLKSSSRTSTGISPSR